MLPRIDETERARQYLDSWRPFWHPVATLAELDAVGPNEFGNQMVLGYEMLNGQPYQFEGRPLFVQLCGQRIVITRLNGQVIAMNGTCPHRSTALARGWRNEAENAVVCPYHGFEWGQSGRIQCIPALQADGHSLPTGSGWAIQVYSTVVRYGLIWVCLDPNPRFPLPDMPEADNPAFTTSRISKQIWQAGCGRMMEAAIDNYHFAFTHQGTIGDPSHPEAPRATIQQLDNYIEVRYSIQQPYNETVGLRAQQGAFETVHYTQRTGVNTSLLYKDSDAGRFVILIGVSPIGPQLSRFFRVNLWNYPMDEPVIFDLENRINRQDQDIVQTMQPWELTTDLDAELQAYVDRPTVTYRRWLAQLNAHYF